MKKSNKYICMIVFSILVVGQSIVSFAQSNDSINKLRQVVKSREITYKLSVQRELKSILGEPEKENTQNDGGMVLLEMTYPKVKILFGKYRD